MAATDDIGQVAQAIANTEGEIKIVEKKIEDVEEQIQTESDPDEKKALREKEKALREKKKALREKEKALREKKMLLLKQHTGTKFQLCGAFGHTANACSSKTVLGLGRQMADLSLINIADVPEDLRGGVLRVAKVHDTGEVGIENEIQVGNAWSEFRQHVARLLHANTADVCLRRPGKSKRYLLRRGVLVAEEVSLLRKGDLVHCFALSEGDRSPPSSPPRAGASGVPFETIKSLLRDERVLPPDRVVSAVVAQAAQRAIDLTDAFPMVGRAGALQELARVLSGQLFAFGTRRPESADVVKSKVIPTCCGASGIGKSRFGRDGPRELLNALGGASGTGAALGLDAGAAKELRRALADALAGGRVLRLGMEEALLEQEKQSPRHAIALRLLHSYCSTFARYQDAYPSYGALHEALGLGAVDVRKVVSLMQQHALAATDSDDSAAADAVAKAPFLLYVNIDETNHLNELAGPWLKDAVSELTRGWHDRECRVLVVPLLSGTNLVEVYDVSGQLGDNITLSLLGVTEYLEILRAILGDSSFEATDLVQGFLSDVAFNPRLLQLALASLSEYAAAQRRGAASSPATPPRGGGAAAGFMSFPFALRFLKEGLACKNEAIFTQAFKLTLERLQDAKLLTVHKWSEPNFGPVRVGVLAHVVFGKPVVLQTEFADNWMVSKLIGHGMVFVKEVTPRSGQYVMLLPYAYLSLMWRATAFPADLVNMHLLKTPTRKLNPEQNECQDVESLLFRFDLFRSISEQSVQLAAWLGLDVGGADEAGPVAMLGSVEIRLPDRNTVALREATKWVTWKDPAQLPSESGVCIVNAKGAPAPDAFLCVTVEPSSLSLLAALRRRVALPRDADGDAAAAELKLTKHFNGVDWRTGDAKSAIGEAAGGTSQLLYIMIQSKRKASTGALSTSKIWVEYCKAREFAPHVPFVLVIVTDKVAPSVPDELQHCVVIVGEGEMERFFGPIVAQRHRTSR